MCLIAFALHDQPEPRLVVAANRDEFHARPARACQWWDDQPILAGRDLQAGGTWLGVSATGRFAAITNYREVPRIEGPRSRGELPVQFLVDDRSAEEFAAALLPRGRDYGGFNLLLYDGRDAVVVSNREQQPVSVTPGTHGISNGGFDTEWPKVQRTRSALAAHLGAGTADEEHLLAMLRDDVPAPPSALPETGVGPELERFLSPPFIRGDSYGTRAATLLWLTHSRAHLVEHRFAADGVPVGRSDFEFDISNKGSGQGQAR